MFFEINASCSQRYQIKSSTYSILLLRYPIFPPTLDDQTLDLVLPPPFPKFFGILFPFPFPACPWEASPAFFLETFIIESLVISVSSSSSSSSDGTVSSAPSSSGTVATRFFLAIVPVAYGVRWTSLL